MWGIQEKGDPCRASRSFYNICKRNFATSRPVNALLAPAKTDHAAWVTHLVTLMNVPWNIMLLFTTGVQIPVAFNPPVILLHTNLRMDSSRCQVINYRDQSVQRRPFVLLIPVVEANTANSTMPESFFPLARTFVS